MSREAADYPGQAGHEDSPEGPLSDYVEAGRQLVDDGIAVFLRRHYNSRILEIVEYVVQGGKRLRGILAMLMCETLGGTAINALPAAVAVELAHAASLAHDDIMDGDGSRRGRAAAHVRYDLATAILVPHLIVPHAILSAQGYGPQALRIILDGWAKVTQGQVRDFLPWDSTGGSRHRLSPKGPAESAEREYHEIIRDKTAALFETAAELGALAASDHQNVTLAREYARWLGCAFQSADDVTDLEQWASQSWAAMLGDRRARSMDALRRMVGEDGEDLIGPTAIEHAKRLASLNVERCIAYVDRFTDSPPRELLRSFPAFAVKQIYAEAGDASRL